MIQDTGKKNKGGTQDKRTRTTTSSTSTTVNSNKQQQQQQQAPVWLNHSITRLGENHTAWRRWGGARGETRASALGETDGSTKRPKRCLLGSSNESTSRFFPGVRQI